MTLPLSLPGVMAGFAFAFIPTIGEFVTPALVGGPDGFLYGNAIANQFGPSFDWKTGSVLALMLFAAVALLGAGLLALPPAPQRRDGRGLAMDVTSRAAAAASSGRSSGCSSSFLYAPIAILVIFSFNDNSIPIFPLSGFTLDWYDEALRERRPAGLAAHERDRRGHLGAAERRARHARVAGTRAAAVPRYGPGGRARSSARW